MDMDKMEVKEFNVKTATKVQLIHVVEEQNKSLEHYENMLEEKEEIIQNIRTSFMDLQKEHLKSIEQLEVRVNRIIRSYEEKLVGLKGIMQSAIMLASADDFLKEDKEGEN